MGACPISPRVSRKTTFFVTVDHGRGSAPIAWKNHGKEIPESAYTWFAVIGPDTAPLGERSDTTPATQSQVAATGRRLCGRRLSRRNPKSCSVYTGVDDLAPSVSPTERTRRKTSTTNGFVRQPPPWGSGASRPSTVGGLPRGGDTDSNAWSRGGHACLPVSQSGPIRGC
jgi:hypothetical protein